MMASSDEGFGPAAEAALAFDLRVGALEEVMCRDLAVVASVCGTDDDPQSSSAQTLALEDAGVSVLPSNAAAVRHALAILRRRDTEAAPPDAVPGPIRRLLAEPPRIVNIGLREFAEALDDRGARVVQCDWRPVAGGDPRLQALIDALN